MTRILILLLFLGPLAFAQAPIEPCKFGQPLIDALQQSYTPSSPLGYNNGRDILYSEIDNVGVELSGIYTGFTVTLDPSEDPSISAFQNGAGINAEHVYPQSYGAGDEPQRSDLHNIFPSKVNVNSERGNCAYGEIEDSDTDLWFYQSIQQNIMPSQDIDLFSEKDEEDCFFEPRESVKGNIARAMFYFYAIYQSEANAENPNFFAPQKAILQQWHEADPVDQQEKTRDSLIASFQGNSNPFILDPSLVERAFFSADASYPEGDPNCYNATTSYTQVHPANWVRLSSNLVEHSLSVFSTQNKGQLLWYDCWGQPLGQQSLQQENTIDLSALPAGIYLLRAKSELGEVVFRFVKAF